MFKIFKNYQPEKVFYSCFISSTGNTSQPPFPNLTKIQRLHQFGAIVSLMYNHSCITKGHMEREIHFFLDYKLRGIFIR